MEIENLKRFVIGQIENLTFSKVKEDDSLIKSKLLDSISSVDLAVAIEDETKISIPAVDINELNFESVNKIAEYVIRKLNGK
jgi:acyl carrier protein